MYILQSKTRGGYVFLVSLQYSKASFADLSTDYIQRFTERRFRSPRSYHRAAPLVSLLLVSPTSPPPTSRNAKNFANGPRPVM